MIDKMIAALNNVSMRKKLFISYFLLITLPISSFVTWNHYRNAQMVKKQILSALERTTQETGLFLNYRTTRLLSIINSLSMDEQLQKVIQQETYSLSDDISAHMAAYNQLSLHLSNLEYTFNVNKIKVYVHKNVPFSNENDHFFRIDAESPPFWYSRLQGQYQAIWLPPQANDAVSRTAPTTVSLAKPIIDMTNYAKIIGILMLDIPVADLTLIMNRDLVTPYTSVLLINSHGEIIHRLGPSQLAIEESLTSKVSAAALPVPSAERSTGYQETVNKRYYFQMIDIEGTDWVLVAVTPRSAIDPHLGSFLVNTMLLITGIAVAAYLLSYIISQSMTKRISMLISQMVRVESGNWNVTLPPSTQDEIGRLTSKFAYLLNQLKVMLNEQLKIGIELKNAELKALQAQINPHFLYNTLDLINWKATEKNAPEISSIVQSLSRFYKLSLSKGKTIVTLDNEIEHIKSYVYLQNMRFRNCIELILDVPVSLQDYLVPKIILQPFVENSILHGIRNRLDEAGYIRITGKAVGDSIVLRLEDNGVGMSEKRLQEIMSNTFESPGSGYGVRNIHDRLRMLYGDRARMSFESRVGVGTVVTMILPIIEHNM